MPSAVPTSALATAPRRLDLPGQLRLQARANRLANRRLHAAMAALPQAEFDARRTGFFPSLAATLNHILVIDEYYIGALRGEADLPARYRAFVASPTLADLADRQRASDERLITICDALDAAACAAMVAMDRGSHVQRDLAAHVLAHLFMHQTHHRGQAHAMLSGTSVKPPQLDEFYSVAEAPLREAEFNELGYTEADVWGE